LYIYTIIGYVLDLNTTTAFCITMVIVDRHHPLTAEMANADKFSKYAVK